MTQRILCKSMNNTMLDTWKSKHPLHIPNFYLYNTGGNCLVHRRDNADNTCWVLAQENGETLCNNEVIVLASLFSEDFEYLGTSMTFKNVKEAIEHFERMEEQ